MEKSMNAKKILALLSEKIKNKQTVLIIFIIGVIIMLTAGAFAPQSEKQSAESVGNYDYCRRLEENLTGILSEMKGVGRVRVMITPEVETDSGNTLFQSGKKTEISDIKGVVIAAEGAGDPKVNEKIYYAAKAALNIGGSRIAVIESK